MNSRTFEVLKMHMDLLLEKSHHSNVIGGGVSFCFVLFFHFSSITYVKCARQNIRSLAGPQMHEFICSARWPEKHY